MNQNAIITKAGSAGVACAVFAATAKNSAILRPLAQTVFRLEENRRNFGYRHALAERYIDAPITVTFESGGAITKQFRDVHIDLSSGRPPRLVFVNTRGEGESLCVDFTQATQEEWLTPRASSGCLDCGDNYTCPSCQEAKQPIPA